MEILVIDTSTEIGGVALLDTEKGLIGEIRFNLKLNKKRTHSEQLAPLLDYMMKSVNQSIDDIDIFTVVTGPGSFTGLRVGLSTVKGFVYVTGKSVVSVSSLESLAWNFPYSKYPVCTILDARKEKVYGAIFTIDNDKISSVLPIGLYKTDEIIGSISQRTIFTGNGSILYKNKIEESLGSNAIFAPYDKIYISPAVVGLIGLKKYLKGEFSDPATICPLYIGISAAEEKHGESN